MKFPEILKPYQGIIYFVIALLIANYFWKFTVSGDENGSLVLFFGLNISSPFVFMASHIARVTHSVLNFFGFDVVLYPKNVLRYANHNNVWIAWGCTGLKQTFIFTVIMLIAKGSWQKKLWYIPLGWVFIYIINMTRIITITAVIKTHPELFILLHEYLFKYIFYILIFLVWVFWEEKIIKKEATKE